MCRMRSYIFLIPRMESRAQKWNKNINTSLTMVTPGSADNYGSSIYTINWKNGGELTFLRIYGHCKVLDRLQFFLVIVMCR